MPKPAGNPRLQAALALWQQWPVAAKPRLVTTFTAGLNHQTYLIEVAGDTQLVLKLFANDLQAAIDSQRWAADLGIAPAVWFADVQAGYALFAYIDADTLDKTNVSMRTLEILAAAIKTMHSDSHNTGDSVDYLGDFDLLRFCEQYLLQVRAERPQLATIHRQLLPALELFIKDPTPWCFCHNDLVAENCFIVAGSAQFIDWEYAQRHNPWFDLAAIILYLDLNPKQARSFLAAYRDGWQETVASPIYYAAQCALLWGDMLWHLHRNGAESWPLLSRKWAILKRIAGQLNINL